MISRIKNMIFKTEVQSSISLHRRFKKDIKAFNDYLFRTKEPMQQYPCTCKIDSVSQNKLQRRKIRQ